MRKKFDIEDTWLSHEIHPDTPAKGVLLTKRFRGFDVAGMYANLREQGAPFGVKFGNMKLLANSRKALEASEYARDRGQYREFHHRMFQAYFTDTQDIGNFKVILAIAVECGLDGDGLRQALEDGRYRGRLEEADREAQKYEVNGVPTFIIEEQEQIVGSQPLQVFEKVLQKMVAGKK